MYFVASRVSLTGLSQLDRFSIQVGLPRPLVGIGFGHQFATHGITVIAVSLNCERVTRFCLQHRPFGFVGEAGAGGDCFAGELGLGVESLFVDGCHLPVLDDLVTVDDDRVHAAPVG